MFKHLNAHEVKQISASMVNMAGFTHDQMAMVLEEFKKDSSEYAALSLNTNDYLRSVLVKALGEERASSLLEDLLDTHQGTNGIETLNFMDPQAVFDLIREEHPQIIATILVHLKRNRRQTCWVNSTSANVTTSCYVSPPLAAYSLPRCRS